MDLDGKCALYRMKRVTTDSIWTIGNPWNPALDHIQGFNPSLLVKDRKTAKCKVYSLTKNIPIT